MSNDAARAVHQDETMDEPITESNITNERDRRWRREAWHAREVLADSTNAALLASMPAIPDLDAQVLDAIERDLGGFDMGDWEGHSGCGTMHCRGGHALVVAGLRIDMRADTRAKLLYAKSVGYVPDFYATNGDALKDIRARAATQHPTAEAGS